MCFIHLISSITPTSGVAINRPNIWDILVQYGTLVDLKVGGSPLGAVSVFDWLSLQCAPSTATACPVSARVCTTSPHLMYKWLNPLVLLLLQALCWGTSVRAMVSRRSSYDTTPTLISSFQHNIQPSRFSLNCQAWRWKWCPMLICALCPPSVL